MISRTLQVLALIVAGFAALYLTMYVSPLVGICIAGLYFGLLYRKWLN